MTALEMKQIEANINKMVADVDLSHKGHELDSKKYLLEQIKLVLYGVAVGAAVVIATVKILN